MRLASFQKQRDDSLQRVSRIGKTSYQCRTRGFNALQVKVGIMPKIDQDDPLEDKKQRQHDTYLDRRSGDDRREKHSLNYFDEGGPERRTHRERRDIRERRTGYTRITPWTSVGPIPDTDSAVPEEHSGGES